ncbi:GGDEF domain-containing protein [Angustibacter sp. McL0619]|uniref:GGDEF domain-containing protein n=1 Tax=Angustibacter sp. McL0619 TaxID=3415676 RepID=UPI003CFA9D23
MSSASSSEPGAGRHPKPLGVAPDSGDVLRHELLALEMTSFQPPPEAHERALEAEHQAVLLGDDVARHRAQLLRANVLSRSGRIAAGARIVRGVSRWAEAHDEQYLQARCHYQLSPFFNDLGDGLRAIEHGLLGVELLDGQEPPEVAASHHLTLGVALASAHCFDLAGEQLDMAARTARLHGSWALYVQVLNNLAFSALLADDLDRASEVGVHLVAVAEARGVVLRPGVLDTLGRIYLATDRAEAVVELITPFSLTPPRSTTRAQGAADALLALAEAHRRLGQLERAATVLDLCLQLAGDDSMAHTRALAQRERSELLAAQGRWRDAFEQHLAFVGEMMQVRDREALARLNTLADLGRPAERHEPPHQLREPSSRDSLTGLANRRQLEATLPSVIAAASGPVSVALIDLDGFAQINETLGSQTGDHLLFAVAARLDDELAEPSYLARVGGQEFLAVLPGHSTDQAAALADRLRAAIADREWTSIAGSAPVTASIGVATTSATIRSQGDLFRVADERLAAAKAAGGNLMLFASPHRLAL